MNCVNSWFCTKECKTTANYIVDALLSPGGGRSQQYHDFHSEKLNAEHWACRWFIQNFIRPRRSEIGDVFLWFSSIVEIATRVHSDAKIYSNSPNFRHPFIFIWKPCNYYFHGKTKAKRTEVVFKKLNLHFCENKCIEKETFHLFCVIVIHI